MKLTCKHCGSTFYHVDSRSMYCSKKCRAANLDKLKTRTLKNCVICGVEFEAKIVQVCCGNACREIRNKQKSREAAANRAMGKDASARVEAAIDRVVRNVWQKSDDCERAIIEFYNPNMRFI